MKNEGARVKKRIIRKITAALKYGEEKMKLENKLGIITKEAQEALQALVAIEGSKYDRERIMGDEVIMLVEKLRNLDRFRGNIAEYSSLKREQGILLDCDIIVPIDTGMPRKYATENNYGGQLNFLEARNIDIGDSNYKLGVKFFRDFIEGRLFKKLLENGCIGLVYYDPIGLFGLPVKIKERPTHPFR